MRWTPEAVADAFRRAGQQAPDLGQLKPPNKFGAIRKSVDGIVFDSSAEARAYVQLKAEESIGLIASLELQPSFLLQEPFRDDAGKWHRAITYRGDFKFLRRSTVEWVCVDVKGVRTPVFNLKEKLMRKRYPTIRLEVWNTRLEVQP